MEVKINSEIRNYTESIFFGLSFKQIIFALLAIGSSVGVYFLLKDRFAINIVSIFCVLAAAPWAAIGFVRYNGMTAIEFVRVWIRSEIVMPSRLVYKGDNIYYDILETAKKEEDKQE